MIIENKILMQRKEFDIMAIFVIVGGIIGFCLMVSFKGLMEFDAIDYGYLLFFVVAMACLGYLIGCVCDAHLTTTYDQQIDLLKTDFSCETDGISKKIHINGIEYDISSIETTSGDGLYLESRKNTTKVRKHTFYTGKLVVGDRLNNEKINMLFGKNIIADNDFYSSDKKIEQEIIDIQVELTNNKTEIAEAENQIENTDNIKSFCSECREYLKELSNFCPSCGYKLVE